jgi:hypothetical protein
MAAAEAADDKIGKYESGKSDSKMKSIKQKT